MFFIFTPKIGEDEPNLTSIFFRWVVQPLTSGSILNLVLASWALKNTMVWHQAKCGRITIPRWPKKPHRKEGITTVPTIFVGVFFFF